MPRWTTVLSHGALLFTASLSSVSFDQSAIFERPTQSSIFVLCISGVLLLLFRSAIPKSVRHSHSAILENGHIRTDPNGHVSSVPNGHKRESSSAGDVSRLLPFQLRRQAVMPIVLAIWARVELFRMSLTDRQCAVSGFTGYLPLLLAIYDYWYIQRRRPPPNYFSDSDSDCEYDVDDELEIQLFESPARYISPTACLAIAHFVAAWVLASPRSTYICPKSAFAHNNVPLFQLIGTLLDLFLVLRIAKIAGTHDTTFSLKDRIAPRIIPKIFFSSAAVVSVDGLIGLIARPLYQKWVLNMDLIYLKSLCWYTLLFTITVVAAVHMLSHFGALHFSIYLTIICTYFPGLNKKFSDPDLTPQHSSLATIVFLIFFLLGTILYLRVEYISGGFGSWKPSQKLIPFVPISAYSLAILMTFYLGWSLLPRRYHLVPYHPIAELMHNAERDFPAWLEQASRSKTITQAANSYEHRYGRSPPPGFNAWYQFATSKTSVVIDDYDAMMDDLLPFWAISPAEIRARTREAISDPWNEAAPISIRNGRAELGFNFQPTHRWMTDGILDMVKEFVEFLPDMDLAFNLNDEPRVTIPFHHMRQLVQAGESAKTAAKLVGHTWSADRAKQWEGPETSYRPFTDWSTMNSFSEATIGCPPNSSARTSVLWDSHVLCTACAAPHSQNGILNDWRLAGSPCHQPDLRNLHGLYLTPSAFKNTRKLVPIFSQSKVGGFSDILYPSPWNYIDKISYHPKNKTHGDPSFKEKINTLFWRGGASEGESRHGTWKGMTRQRIVHVANNWTSSSRSADIPMLLPHRTRNGRLSPQYLPTPIQTLNLSLDMGFVNRIERAWDNDEIDQEREFGLHDAMDFQAHWNYRYLFDTDGAGFSGRFIPFLLSKSLPFRSGLFRTWYDSRIMAWAHFVPVDVRLHGLFSTLGYFMGTQGIAGSRTLKARVGMEARVTEAERIAQAGRYWARMALRKEDMEVFMFRLLLEWGRLTDDARDEIGFKAEDEDAKSGVAKGWVGSVAAEA